MYLSKETSDQYPKQEVKLNQHGNTAHFHMDRHELLLNQSLRSWIKGNEIRKKKKESKFFPFLNTFGSLEGSLRVKFKYITLNDWAASTRLMKIFSLAVALPLDQLQGTFGPALFLSNSAKYKLVVNLQSLIFIFFIFTISSFFIWNPK